MRAVRPQYLYVRGKLLLTGEYFVLSGACSLALPTHCGQLMHVACRKSFAEAPILTWEAFTREKLSWLKICFEFWHFDLVSFDPEQEREALYLQNILRRARELNGHFLREEIDVSVQTFLEFPLNWGLGSSAGLVGLIAQWAHVDPFELFFKVFRQGSGCDVACAMAESPICYQLRSDGPRVQPLLFSPAFHQQLAFVYLERKQCSQQGIAEYFRIEKISNSNNGVQKISNITKAVIACRSLERFQKLIAEHEELVSGFLDRPRLQNEIFADRPLDMEIKSLGAWGGDFVLVASSLPQAEVKKYFAHKGYSVFIPYAEMVYYGQ